MDRFETFSLQRLISRRKVRERLDNARVLPQAPIVCLDSLVSGGRQTGYVVLLQEINFSLLQPWHVLVGDSTLSAHMLPDDLLIHLF